MTVAIAQDSSASEPPKGDIVSTYPRIVGTFVLLRLVCWTILILEMADVDMGSGISMAIVETSSAMEIVYCQLMFYGTLHFGLLSSERLEWICRVAFLLMAPLLIKGFTVHSSVTAGAGGRAERYRPGEPVDMSGSIRTGIIWLLR